MGELQKYDDQSNLKEEKLTKGLIFDPVKTAGFIREQHSTVLSSILEIGRHLINAKLKLGYGEYQEWVKLHCGLSRRTARFYAQCARIGYEHREKIASMKATAFASLMKLPDDIFSLAIDEGELDGKPLDSLNKREVESYFARIKADRDSERQRRDRAEGFLEEGTAQLSRSEEEVYLLKKQIEELKTPDGISNSKLEQSHSLVSQAVLLLLKLSNIEVPTDAAGDILSPLILATQKLQEKWKPKWEG